MGEHLPDDQDPYMRLNFGGEFFDATPENTSAYIYKDDLMEFNHVETDMGDDEEGNQKTMCFFPDHEQYAVMMSFMAAHNYPLFVNLQHVDDYVLDAYIDWMERNKESEPPKEPAPLRLPAPTPDPEYVVTELSTDEVAGLSTVKARYDAEQTRLANLPMDERNVCLRALEKAREEWLPYYLEDKRADHMARVPRLEAARLLIPIDALLDQLYKIDHPEEA